MTTASTAIPNCPSRTGTRSTCCGSNDGTCRDQTADGCPAEPAASRRARQAGVAGHGFCGHAWAATAPRGPSVDVSERQMGLCRLGTESSPDSPLEEAGFEPSVPRQGTAFFTEGNELYPLPINHQVGDHASGEKRLSQGRRTRCQRLRSLH